MRGSDKTLEKIATIQFFSPTDANLMKLDELYLTLRIIRSIGMIK